MKSYPGTRLASLDVFRGLTIAGMILVNTILLSPYKVLDHSEWNGCTFADLVFPFFVFILGVSLVFALSNQIKNHVPTADIALKICKRTLIITALGLLLNAFPHHLTSETLTTLRIYGVLQRIALCYFFASMIYLTLNTYMQIGLTVLLLLGYWALLIFYPVPGYGAGDLTPAGNLGAYLDRSLLPEKNLYGKVFDPEGLLSTLPAIGTALLGNLTGIALLTRYSAQKKCIGMLVSGIILMIAGWIWGYAFPINKALWTSSYVLWTGGIALIVFAICYALIEIKHITKWALPFKIFGLNAIFAYFFHVLFFKIQLMIHVTCPNGTSCNLRNYILNAVFGWASMPYACLYYAIGSVLFWLLILTILYRNKIFIRI